MFGELYVYRWSSGREHDIDSFESDIFNCFKEDFEVVNVMNLSSKSSSSSEEIELHQIQAHVSSESLVSFDFGLLLCCCFCNVHIIDLYIIIGVRYIVKHA